MQIWRVFLLIFICTLPSLSFADYTLENSKPIISSQSNGKSSRLLDLTPLLQQNLSVAVKNPDNGQISYTHNGKFIKRGDYFYQNKDRLQGYTLPSELISPDCKLQDIKIPDDFMPAKPTQLVKFKNVNLNSEAIIPGPFDPSNPSTYDYKISDDIIDGKDNNHHLVIYFAKATADEWHAYIYADQISIGKGYMIFRGGVLSSSTGFSGLIVKLDGGATQTIAIEVTGTTQNNAPFKSDSLTNDGVHVGDGFEETVDSNGYLVKNYTNGTSILFSKVGVFKQ